jgi:hypothetical protein
LVKLRLYLPRWLQPISFHQVFGICIRAINFYAFPVIGSGQLQRLRLVDTYVESIWGLRLRRSDVEKAAMVHVMESIQIEDAMSLFLAERAAAKATEVVKRLVACEGKTERIIGGDRFTDI